MPPRRQPSRRSRRVTKKGLPRTRTLGISRSLVKAAMPHYHCRWETSAKEITREVTLDTTGLQLGKISFNVNDLEAVNELAILYDNFILTKCVVYATWQPVLSGTQSNNTDAWAPVLKYFYDYDDDSIPTDSEFRQRSKVKIRQMTPQRKTVKMAITPAVLMTGYQGLTSSIYIPKFKQEIDMGSKNVEQYGIKYMLEYPAGIANGTVNFRIKYYLTCKNTR